MNKYKLYQAETFPPFIQKWVPISVVAEGQTIPECLEEIKRSDEQNKSSVKSPKRIINKYTGKEVWSRNALSKISYNSEYDSNITQSLQTQK